VVGLTVGRCKKNSFQIIYCEKMKALQAGIGASQECYLNRLAWDNEIRLCAYFVGFDVHNNEEWR
jgi:hypothetical protein